MISQRRIAHGLLALALGVGLGLGLAACDGGTSGTGISTAEGNVASIGAADMMGTDLAGIRVSVAGTSASGATDASGSFSVKGVFDGHRTLLFQRSSDNLDAQLPMNLPSRGILTLNDVTIDRQSGEASAASQQLQFQGFVQSVDCTKGEIAFVADPGDEDTYLVDVAGSTLESSSGAPVACTDVKVGESAAINGTVEEDGSIGSAVVRFGG
jgi:hypothetical protein